MTNYTDHDEQVDMECFRGLTESTFRKLQLTVAESDAFRAQKRQLQLQQDALRVRDSIERLFDVDTTVLSDGFVQKIENRLSDLLIQMQTMLSLQPEMYSQVRESVLLRGEFPQSLDPILIERIRSDIKDWLQAAADEKQHQLSVKYNLVGIQHAGFVNTPVLVSSDDAEPVRYSAVPGANIFDLEAVVVGPEIDGVDSDDEACRLFLHPAAWPVQVSGEAFYSKLPRCGARVLSREERIASFGIDRYDYQFGFAVVALVSAKGTVKATVACDTDELLTLTTRRFDAVVEAGDQVRLVSRLFSRASDARGYASDLGGRKGKRGELVSDPKKVLGGVR